MRLLAETRDTIVRKWVRAMVHKVGGIKIIALFCHAPAALSQDEDLELANLVEKLLEGWVRVRMLIEFTHRSKLISQVSLARTALGGAWFGSFAGTWKKVRAIVEGADGHDTGLN